MTQPSGTQRMTANRTGSSTKAANARHTNGRTAIDTPNQNDSLTHKT